MGKKGSRLKHKGLEISAGGKAYVFELNSNPEIFKLSVVWIKCQSCTKTTEVERTIKCDIKFKIIELSDWYKRKITYTFSSRNCQAYVWCMLFIITGQNFDGVFETNRGRIHRKVLAFAECGRNIWVNDFPSYVIDEVAVLEGDEAEEELGDE